MESLLDRSSPRRGSLNSLHRYSSGSFSSNQKQASPSNTLQVSSTNLYALCKDLDKFTRYFIVKAVQVIVQSRINGSQKVKTDCKSSGNDWFNLNISDIVEVSDKTKSVLDAEGLSVKSNWRVCCEISLKTNDGSRVVLEHWIISNRTNFNSSQRLNSGQGSPKSYSTNKTPTNHLTSSNTSNGGGLGGAGGFPLGAINSSGRVRPATFSNTSRTRLNSIDDIVGENNVTTNKLLMAVNNENADIKPSTSCFSLSSAPASNQHTETNNVITESPSTNSLNNNTTTNISNTTQDQQLASNTNISSLQSQNSTNKTSATSSIYTIYNRMSLLLKTLLTTTHVVPAYRMASRTTQTDSCVICYRVYTAPKQGLTSRGSIEDINTNLNHSESPNRRSLTSASSLGSIDIREFVGPDDLDHFCPVLKLGSIKTEVNELDVSLCYRTDIRGSSYSLKSPRSRDMYNRILDEDCLTAAKQLLAGNECLRDAKFNRDHRKSGSDNSLNYEQRNSDQKALAFLEQPLKPAFASLGEHGLDQTNKNLSSNGSGGCELIESAFESLLRNKSNSPNNDDMINAANGTTSNKPSNGHPQTTADNCKSNGFRSANAQSEPIQVPNSKTRNQQVEQNHHLIVTPGSTPKSLTDSYVFVDLNPPFASDDQNDINSFFHGPSPSFSNGFSSSKDVDELTSQLATIEANASQIDDFVDNMCASEDDECSERDDHER